MNAAPLTPEQEARYHRRQRAAFCLRLVSHLVFLKLFLLGLTFAFFTLRSAEPFSLAPFSTHELRFCPKWFAGVDVVASYPASEHVSVHKRIIRPQLGQAHTYEVGYNVTLHADAYTRSHLRSYYFPANTQLEVEVESDVAVHFMVVHPEHRERRVRRSEEPAAEAASEGRHHGHREGGRHGDRDREHNRPEHHRPEQPAEPQHPTGQPATGTTKSQQDSRTRHSFRAVTLKDGEYDFIFWLPKNSTQRANIQLRLKPTVKTIDLSGSCPIKSSLTAGHRFIRFRKHQEQHVFLAASPYAPSSSVVFVRLIPRACKFVSTAAVLLGVWAVLRLAARFLAAHSLPSTGGNGKCFWSRLFRSRRCARQGYAPVAQNEVVVEMPVASNPVVFYTPNTIN